MSGKYVYGKIRQQLRKELGELFAEKERYQAKINDLQSLRTRIKDEWGALHITSTEELIIRLQEDNRNKTDELSAAKKEIADQAQIIYVLYDTLHRN